MALYSALLPLLECEQWFKNGDHKEDRTIHGLNEGRVVNRHPSVKDPDDINTVCSICGIVMGKHGKLNPAIHLQEATHTGEVCPGDYIQTHRREDGRVSGYTVYKRELFEFFYEPYKEPKV